jgi:flagellar protein FlaG
MAQIDALSASGPTAASTVGRTPQAAQVGQAQAEAASQLASAEPDPGTSVSSQDPRAIAAQVKQVVETSSAHQLSMNIDPDNKELYMQVTDANTGEVIAQIPTKEMRDLHQRLQSTAGLLLNKKA